MTVLSVLPLILIFAAVAFVVSAMLESERRSRGGKTEQSSVAKPKPKDTGQDPWELIGWCKAEGEGGCETYELKLRDGTLVRCRWLISSFWYLYPSGASASTKLSDRCDEHRRRIEWGVVNHLRVPDDSAGKRIVSAALPALPPAAKDSWN